MLLSLPHPLVHDPTDMWSGKNYSPNWNKLLVNIGLDHTSQGEWKTQPKLIIALYINTVTVVCNLKGGIFTALNNSSSSKSDWLVILSIVLIIFRMHPRG